MSLKRLRKVDDFVRIIRIGGGAATAAPRLLLSFPQIGGIRGMFRVPYGGVRRRVAAVCPELVCLSRRGGGADVSHKNPTDDFG
ncbi:protein of unknown function (plasmid) [Azospirillum baldaniorum]|uniref:Uncharacterized protein n=1 Tax=Azospirillum baldaniorum TaxID=1064539 RepID=A0A9P1JVL8_9PROT|nr:protein of unknown function [Azospirillum baldaniorum]